MRTQPPRNRPFLPALLASLGLCVGFDWNGDGRADLPVAGHDEPGSAGEIFIHLGGSDEVLRIPIPAPARAIWDMGDFDGDGRSALAVGWEGQDLAIYDPLVLAGQDPQRPQPAAWLKHTSRVVATGDIDGDGDTDFVAGAGVCLGELPAPCAQALGMGTRGDTVLPLDDVDGDGKAEVCINDLLIFGGVAGEEARQRDLPWMPVDAFDWDRDGDLDLLWVEKAAEPCGGARLSVLEQRDGDFVAGPVFDLSTAEDKARCKAGEIRLFVPRDGTATDADGDGHSDVFFVQDTTLYVWYGPNGVRREALGPAWSGLLPRRVGDVDGDGFADLLLTTSGEHFVHGLFLLGPSGRRQVPAPAHYRPGEQDAWGGVRFRVFP